MTARRLVRLQREIAAYSDTAEGAAFGTIILLVWGFGILPLLVVLFADACAGG